MFLMYSFGIFSNSSVAIKNKSSNFFGNLSETQLRNMPNIFYIFKSGDCFERNKCLVSKKMLGFLWFMSRGVMLLENFVNMKEVKDADKISTFLIKFHHCFIRKKKWKINHFLGRTPIFYRFLDSTEIFLDKLELVSCIWKIYCE